MIEIKNNNLMCVDVYEDYSILIDGLHVQLLKGEKEIGEAKFPINLSSENLKAFLEELIRNLEIEEREKMVLVEKISEKLSQLYIHELRQEIEKEKVRGILSKYLVEEGLDLSFIKELSFEEKRNWLSKKDFGFLKEVANEVAYELGYLENTKDAKNLSASEKAVLFSKILLELQLFSFCNLELENEEELVVVENGLIVERGEEVVRNLVYSAFSDEVTVEVYKNVLNNVKAKAKLISQDKVNPSDYMLFENGILDIKTLDVFDRSIYEDLDIYFTYSVPLSLDLSFLKQLREGKISEEYFQNCAFYKAVRRFYDDENWSLLKLCLGAILYNNSLKLLVIVVGPPNTGKTTLAVLLLDILGDFAASVSLERLQEDRFSMEPFIKASVNVTEERPSNTFRDIEKLKRITGGSSLEIPRKFKPSFILRNNKIKWFMFCNKLPRFREIDEALADRIVVVFTINPLTEEEVDSKVKEELNKKESKEEFLEFLLYCYYELSRDNFKIPKDKEKVTELLDEARFPLSEWIEDDCEEDKVYKTLREDLFDRYIQWCNNHKEKVEKVLTRREFYEVLRTRFQQVVIHGRYYFKGIALKNKE
ncbi:MAG: DUF5906 domain-containing protein [Thermoproteota archaeon]